VEVRASRRDAISFVFVGLPSDAEPLATLPGRCDFLFQRGLEPAFVEPTRQDSVLTSGVALPRLHPVQRTCQAWLDDLGPGSGPVREGALSDLRDLLRRSLGRSFGGKFSDDDLDDLTQESLLRIHERLHTFEKRSRFTTWAVSIAVNGAYSELRRRRHQHVSLEDAMQQGAASLVQAAETQREPDREDMLRDAINLALTPRQRDAMLALLGGLPLAEVARRLSTSQGAIYKLLHDARRRLRHHLEAQERATPIPHQAKGDLP
jgi:RNA polymerase sigma-70 factor (ECF subfamily)